MSRAFVREDAGERWTPPAPKREYSILFDGVALHETDDLLEALQWAGTRERSGFEVRSKDGLLLATA